MLSLHCLFHADDVHHQLEVGQDFRLVAADIAFDSFVGQQLGEVVLATSPLSPYQSKFEKPEVCKIN